MDVIFRRTGKRRYAVIATSRGEQIRVMNPAPGFDDFIPHDLVHYVVEAELGLRYGVFGRAELGGGTFTSVTSDDASPRQRARQRRKQLRRESSLRHADEAKQQDMVTSERLTAVCDILWRRRQGQRPDEFRPAPSVSLSDEDARRVNRVVRRLDELAPLWKRLPVGGELLFTWPSVAPKVSG